MKLTILPKMLLLALVAASDAWAASEPTVLKLWPEGPLEKPGVMIGPEKVMPPKDENDVLRITNVSEPTIAIYRPVSQNGTAVIVCPGGGYGILAIEHEGTQVCEWLNGLGVTAVLLKYRVPVRQAVPGYEPLQDAQRAMAILRARSAEFGIAPQRIGILGFSAGGHLAVMTAFHAKERMYRIDPQIDIEDISPNFVIPIYPAYLVSKEDPFTLLGLCKPSAGAPPACIIHANDDKGTTSSSASAMLYLEYKKLGIPAELHIFSSGGHGFGMRRKGNPASDWPERVADWMRESGWLGEKRKS